MPLRRWSSRSGRFVFVFLEVLVELLLNKKPASCTLAAMGSQLNICRLVRERTFRCCDAMHWLQFVLRAFPMPWRVVVDVWWARFLLVISKSDSDTAPKAIQRTSRPSFGLHGKRKMGCGVDILVTFAGDFHIEHCVLAT